MMGARSLSRLMGGPEPPVPQHAVLEQEFIHLHGRLPDGYPVANPDPDQRLEEIHTAIHAQAHTALCLSGGGIRSASFAVGVLQGLARRHLLPSVDFLSTVSGGGYTGAWFSAWLCHTIVNGGTPAAMFEQLSGSEASAAQPEPEPIRRIREYSSYLDPKVGAFSVDVWTLVATIARNLLLNALILIPLLAAALLVPRVYFALTDLGSQEWIERTALQTCSWWLAIVAIALIAFSMIYSVADLPSGGNRQGSQRAFLVLCQLPLWLGVAGLTLYWAWSRELDADPVSFRALVLLGVAVHMSAWVLASAASGHWWRPWTWLAAAVSGAVAGGGAWWLASEAFADPLARAELYASTGVPLLLLLLGGAGTLFIGLSSSEMTDEDREWQSRFGAWLLIISACWLAGSCVVFVGPMALQSATAEVTSVLHAGPATAKALIGLITALAGGAAARTSRATNDFSQPPSLVRRVVFLTAAPAFVVLLLVLLAALNVGLMTRLDAMHLLPDYPHPSGAGVPEIGVLLLVLVGAGILMGFFIAVNKFSLHGMYRDRLTRAFIGASRPKSARHPDRFTGFDAQDNLFLSELAAVPRPLHVVNMALNLVADNRLAWQERKAESFTVSPLFAGTCTLGYRPIAQYGGPQGMSLGTAITISGAAASPNMGYHSSPALTFLLTLCNARLGAWLGNPGAAGRLTWRRRDPLHGAGPLLREMFGRTTDQNPYVYLSDGGHFENLGLYEMVARRCRYIVVSDAGCDRDYEFEDLGAAIRKIRIDLGVPIVFESGISIDAAHQGAGNKHGAYAVVQYSAVDKGMPDGVLLYLKATLSGNEPEDVRSYADAHPAFPHESTADQWFGESQFESYRALGLHTIDEMLGTYTASSDSASLASALMARAFAAKRPATTHGPAESEV
jgi:hypothetical protein